MPKRTIDELDELDDIDVEGPGGTQLTHPLREGRDVRGGLEREIRNHPIRSVAAALLGGYLLAKLVD